MALLGIDLGTANVRTIVVPKRGLPTAADVVVAPAIVSFNAGVISVGDTVLMMAGAVDDVVVRGLKRLLGRKSDDALVKRACERIELTAHAHGGDDLELRRAERDTFGMSAAQATADLLRDSCQIATGHRGVKHEAVVAVPSWFEEPHRQALLAAADRAQIKVLRFVRDTVASGLWASEAQQVRGNVAVVDAGAGGVSASVLSVTDEALTLVASHGRAEIGGNDIDAELAMAALERADRQTRELLRQASEAMKHELADGDHVERKVTLPGGKSLLVSIERWELELLLAGLAKQIAALCERVLSQAKIEPNQLQAVLATGGMTALPAIGGRIEGSLGTRTEGIPSTDSVVLGAAHLASMAAGRSQGLELNDGEEAPELNRASKPGRRKRQHSWVSAAQVTTTRKAVVRNRPDVKRRRIDPRKRGARHLSTIPPGPTEIAAAPPSMPDAAPIPSDAEPADTIDTTSPEVTAAGEGAEAPSTEPAPTDPAPTDPAPTDPAPTDRVPTPEPEPTDPSASDPPPAGTKPAAPSDEAKESTPPTTPASPQPSEAPEGSAPPGRSSPPSPPSEVKVESARPASASYGRTKFPARDGQTKYPARDGGPRSAAKRPSLSTLPGTTSATEPPKAAETAAVGTGTVPGVGGGVAEQVREKVAAHSTPVPRSVGKPAGGRRATLPTPQTPTEGTLTVPADAAEILALGITRQLLAQDLEPIAAPVLLRRLLGRRTVTGTLLLKGGKMDLAIDIESGNARMTRGEHTEFMHMFETEGVKWKLTPGREDESGGELYPLPRLALEGLRRMLRGLPKEQFADALGSRLRRAPILRPEHATLPKRLGLSPRELRFVSEYIDGDASALALSRSVILGASTCFQIIALLELYSALEWREATHHGPTSVAGGASSAPPPSPPPPSGPKDES